MSCVPRSLTTPTSAMRGRERALAPGGDLVHVAEFAGFDPLPQGLQGRIEPLDVADGADKVLGLERVDEALAGFRAGGDRLLDEGVDAGFGQGQSDLLVEAGRDGSDGHVDAGPAISSSTEDSTFSRPATPCGSP